MVKRIISLICLLVLMSGIASVASAATTVEAPTYLNVELKNYDDGMPYFQLTVGVPASVEALYTSASEQNATLFYETEYKVGNNDWEQTGGVNFELGNQIIMNPDDMGINGTVDIKSSTYSFRVRFGYYLFSSEDENGNTTSEGQLYSPFSTAASIGIEAYQKPYEGASSWAVTELDKAAEYGFITNKISGNMNAPITREELCEVTMIMYEKIKGEASYMNLTAFSDTQNPEIYKALKLGITDGVGNGKYAPNDLTNREQVATMTYRAVKAINPNADFSTAGAETFKDEKLISSWALVSVKFMNKNGFIKGSAGFVNPQGTTTREQAVLMILRTYEKYKT